MNKYKCIGRGHFTTAYLMTPNKVLLKSRDPIKECMSHGWFPSSNLFPKIERTDEYNEYTMKYYPKVKSLKASLQPADYIMYQQLRALSIGYIKNTYDMLDAWRDAFKTLKNRRLRLALTEAIEACSNYGSDISFEISPRNVAVSRNGRLILLDCFFVVSAIKRINT